jgi:hypothetical protein
MTPKLGTILLPPLLHGRGSPSDVSVCFPLQEVSLLKMLNHPCIVSLHEAVLTADLQVGDGRRRRVGMMMMMMINMMMTTTADDDDGDDDAMLIITVMMTCQSLLFIMSYCESGDLAKQIQLQRKLGKPFAEKVVIRSGPLLLQPGSAHAATHTTKRLIMPARRQQESQHAHLNGALRQHPWS